MNDNIKENVPGSQIHINQGIWLSKYACLSLGCAIAIFELLQKLKSNMIALKA